MLPISARVASGACARPWAGADVLHSAVIPSPEPIDETIPASEPAVPADGRFDRASLPDLLREVATDGWNSPAGTRAVTVMQRACRREAMRWTWTAGWMTDEGLADTWEQMDRLMRSGRFEDAPGLLLKVVRRAYAGEAAAVQTGWDRPQLAASWPPMTDGG
jgi:hypothetical protein